MQTLTSFELCQTTTLLTTILDRSEDFIAAGDLDEASVSHLVALDTSLSAHYLGSLNNSSQSTTVSLTKASCDLIITALGLYEEIMESEHSSGNLESADLFEINAGIEEQKRLYKQIALNHDMQNHFFAISAEGKVYDLGAHESLNDAYDTEIGSRANFVFDFETAKSLQAQLAASTVA